VSHGSSRDSARGPHAYRHGRVAPKNEEVLASRVARPHRAGWHDCATRHGRAPSSRRRNLNSFDCGFWDISGSWFFFTREHLLEEIFRVFERILFSCIWIEFVTVEDCSTFQQQLNQVCSQFSLFSSLLF